MPLSKDDPSLDYDGSWRDASQKWPFLRFATEGEARHAYAVAVAMKVPYGSYVLVDKELRLETEELVARVSKNLKLVVTGRTKT